MAYPKIKVNVIKCTRVIEMETVSAGKKATRSWTISDELWERIEGYIPQHKRDAQKRYQHSPGQGRRPLPARKVLEGIFYVLRTGCQWKAVPREYGSGSPVHRRFQEWQKAGFFEEIWALALT